MRLYLKRRDYLNKLIVILGGVILRKKMCTLKWTTIRLKGVVDRDRIENRVTTVPFRLFVVVLVFSFENIWGNVKMKH